MYKVLRNDNGNLVSVNKKDKFNLVYNQTDWTQPTVESSRLFVLETLNDAEAFYNSLSKKHPNLEIWECDVEGVGNIQPLENIKEAEEYWTQRKNHKPTSNRKRRQYSGMVSVTKLKLTRKIK